MGAAALLAVAFAALLAVRDQPASAASILPLPSVCGDPHAKHGGASMQEHMDMMAANGPSSCGIVANHGADALGHVERHNCRGLPDSICVQNYPTPPGRVGDGANRLAVLGRSLDQNVCSGDHRRTTGKDCRKAGLVGEVFAYKMSASTLLVAL